MALDDKTFQSALDKINKIKSRQAASIPQVQVFEDPPHLKNFNSQNGRESPEVSSSAYSELGPIQNPIEDKLLVDSIKIESPDPLLASPTIANHDIKYGTKEGTEMGYNPLNRVQNYDTIQGTKQGTFQGTEIGYKSLNRVQNYDTIQGTEKGTEQRVNLVNSLDAELDQLNLEYKRTYDSLHGIPKKIVDTVFEICRKYNTKKTPPVSFSVLVKLCKEKKNSVKVARQRLMDAGIIHTQSPENRPKRGRSSTLIYGLSDDIFNDIDTRISLILRKGELTNRGIKYGTEKGSPPYSSSSYNINTTTTSTLPDEWLKIDFSHIQTIGFSETQIRQLYELGTITPEMIQQSIEHFAFALKSNPKVKAYLEPLNVLMGVLRKGGTWFEKNYISLKEKALSETLAIKKQETVRMAELKDQIFEQEYKTWRINISESTKNEILNRFPPISKILSITMVEKTNEGYLKKYFKEVLFTNKQNEI